MKKATQPLTIAESMNKKAVVNSQQILHIMQKTPAEHIYKRPGKGGATWDYVTGTYVKKVLNYVFGWDWDFQVIEHFEKANQLCVLGRLTVRTDKGKAISKDQWGRVDIKVKKDTGQPLDYGNDLKAATTDALKKCASEFGIASDIYGKNEFKEIKIEEVASLPQPEKLAAAEKAAVVETKIDIVGKREELENDN